jgi:murein DD-endopeptidase MepM/ murein hydrolase activator NlpD
MLELAYPCNPSYPISQRFGENPGVYARFGLAGHNGLDFACPTGSVIFAALKGTVMYSQEDPDGYGLNVRLLHPGGWVTIYAHLRQVVARPGMTVRSGQLLGFSDNSGFSTGPHLHFELREQGRAVDPEPHLEATLEGKTPPTLTQTESR